MVPIPAASELPVIPCTPSFDVGVSICVNSSGLEQMCCVAQLSAPNSVGVGMKEKGSGCGVSVASASCSEYKQ